MSTPNKSNHARGKNKISNAARNAAWRESNAAKLEELVDELNAKRAQLNLPKVSLRLPRASLKGTKKPNYSPPTKMPQEDVKNWKLDQRKKRKAAMQRENRRRRTELIKSYREQLAVLNKLIEDQKAKPFEALDYGISGFDAVGGAISDLQLTPVPAEEEYKVISPLAGLDDLDTYSWEDGNHSSPNESIDIPNNVVCHRKDDTLYDSDDSSLPANNDIFRGEDSTFTRI